MVPSEPNKVAKKLSLEQLRDTQNNLGILRPFGSSKAKAIKKATKTHQAT